LTFKISIRDITQHKGINIYLAMSSIHPIGIYKYVIKVADIKEVHRLVLLFEPRSGFDELKFEFVFRIHVRSPLFPLL
jgi:hypothetical protein